MSCITYHITPNTHNLKANATNLPSVRPIESTANPVHSKTFRQIYSFFNQPFSLGTIHISSLYPLQDCMGKVYLQKRTQAFLTELGENMVWIQIGLVSFQHLQCNC